MERECNIPSLRFSGFNDSWHSRRFDQLLLSSRLGGNYSNTLVESEHPLIKMGNIGRGSVKLDKLEFIPSSEKIDPSDKLEYGDLLFNTRNTLELVGKVAVWKAELPDAYYNSNLMNIQFEDNFFMNYRLNSHQGIKALRAIATGTTSVAAIYNKDLVLVRLRVPSLPEQQKIASFLTYVDDKIQQLSKKKALLEQYKKGVMQQLFSQKLRFKDDQGNAFPDWEEKQLSQLAERVTSKNKVGNTNVLTISAQQGLIGQLDYFNNSVAARDLSGYYLLSRDDFAYNKSYSAGYPMGAIKRLIRYENGVVSTLYICFRMNDMLDNTFAEQYFESGIHNKEIEKVAQEGARNHGLLNIGVVDFFNISLIIPCKLEQIKIARFLSAIDDRINRVNKQVEHTKQFKKGLLQQMFI